MGGESKKLLAAFGPQSSKRDELFSAGTFRYLIHQTGGLLCASYSDGPRRSKTGPSQASFCLWQRMTFPTRLNLCRDIHFRTVELHSPAVRPNFHVKNLNSEKDAPGPIHAEMCRPLQGFYRKRQISLVHRRTSTSISGSQSKLIPSIVHKAPIFKILLQFCRDERPKRPSA